MERVPLEELWSPKHESPYDYNTGYEKLDVYGDFLRGEAADPTYHFNRMNFAYHYGGQTVVWFHQDDDGKFKQELISICKRRQGMAHRAGNYLVKETGKHTVSDIVNDRYVVDMSGRFYYHKELEFVAWVDRKEQTKDLYVRFDEINAETNIYDYVKYANERKISQEAAVALMEYRSMGMDVRDELKNYLPKYPRDVKSRTASQIMQCKPFYSVRSRLAHNGKVLMDPTARFVPVEYWLSRDVFVSRNGYVCSTDHYECVTSDEVARERLILLFF